MRNNVNDPAHKGRGLKEPHIKRIGTRGSKLALVQTDLVERALREAYPEIDIQVVVIKTKGDRIKDTPLAKIGDKGLFIQEIEEALLKKEIDMAVHSLKDLPTELPDNLSLGAVLERGDARDALVSRDGQTLKEISDTQTIATSSLRRRAQLLKYNSAFTITDIRGNVDTRLRKMREGRCDALILATCGLVRAGYAHMITERIDPDIMLPAVCQGIIGIEIREDDDDTAELLAPMNCRDTFRVALAERAFLKKLQGGCQIPVGCVSSVNGESFTLRGFLSDIEGKTAIKQGLSGPLADAVTLAESLAERMLRDGGEQILASIRRDSG